MADSVSLLLFIILMGLHFMVGVPVEVLILWIVCMNRAHMNREEDSPND